MDESVAAHKADALLLELITNQPQVIPPNSLSSAENAQTVAQAVAAFRQTLVQELVKQDH